MANWKNNNVISKEDSVNNFLIKEEKTNVKKFFMKALGEKNDLGMANLMAVISGNEKLADCEPMSIASSLIIPTMLGLSVSQGDVAIIPYGNKATMQLQINGIIQLALRTNQYKTLGVTKVVEGDSKKSLKQKITISDDFVFSSETSFERNDKKAIGYYAYFKLLNGFEKEFYMNIDELEKHAAKYSKGWNKNTKKYYIADNDKMFKKTVLKNLISKFGPKSNEITKILNVDDKEFVANKVKKIENKNDKVSKEEVLNFLKETKSKNNFTNREETENFILSKTNLITLNWQNMTIKEFEEIKNKML